VNNVRWIPGPFDPAKFRAYTASGVVCPVDPGTADLKACGPVGRILASWSPALIGEYAAMRQFMKFDEGKPCWGCSFADGMPSAIYLPIRRGGTPPAVAAFWGLVGLMERLKGYTWSPTILIPLEGFREAIEDFGHYAEPPAPRKAPGVRALLEAMLPHSPHVKFVVIGQGEKEGVMP